MRLLREAIEQIGKLFESHGVLNDDVYKYLNMCYNKVLLPDVEYLKRLVNEQLRKEVEEWQVRKKD